MNSLTASEMRPTGRARETAPVVIKVEHVSVHYKVQRDRIRSFKEYAIRRMQRRVSQEDFAALRDVSLEIRESEVFGIIGRNGAGKSTLLKVVSRVMKPTTGRVWVCGRVAPLLEIGAGFHHELTGRENVYLNGTLLGFSRAEMSAQFDDIVEFAELWDFIDAPLRTYSSGMVSRLGFAVATSRQPDILIVDEALSVGDEQFRKKCSERVRLFRESGTTTLLVTHDPELAQNLCDRAALLDHGSMRAIGRVDDVIKEYHSNV